MICKNCNYSNENNARFCAMCGIESVKMAQNALPSFVSFTPNDEIVVRATTVAEAKLALKELKLKKKEQSILKRQLMEQERQIRATYTDTVRRRGSKFQGNGTIGKYVRIYQTAKNDATRSNLAVELTPLEHQKSRCEAMLQLLNKFILQVEMFILSNS